MADRVLPGPIDSSVSINEAVCIHTKKIIDSCKDKDCIEDLRVFPFLSSQPLLESACSIRPRAAKLLHAAIKVEEITFNRGYYTVDVTFVYRITGETVPACAEVKGIAVFSKRVMLYGSEGSASIFSSDCAAATVSPVATVEVVDPIVLGMKLTESGSALMGDAGAAVIPPEVMSYVDEPLSLSDCGRLWYVTLGQFSIVRLERDTQIVIPMYDYCMPTKECVGAAEDDPCTLFSRIDFPINEFYPPDCPEEPGT
jgi:hypothetical protein